MLLPFSSLSPASHAWPAVPKEEASECAEAVPEAYQRADAVPGKFGFVDEAQFGARNETPFSGLDNLNHHPNAYTNAVIQVHPIGHATRSLSSLDSFCFHAIRLHTVECFSIFTPKFCSFCVDNDLFAEQKLCTLCSPDADPP